MTAPLVVKVLSWRVLVIMPYQQDQEWLLIIKCLKMFLMSGLDMRFVVARGD